jgi:hypothetical protein
MQFALRSDLLVSKFSISHGHVGNNIATLPWMDASRCSIPKKKQKQESGTGTSVSGPVDAHADTFETDMLT